MAKKKIMGNSRSFREMLYLGLLDDWGEKNFSYFQLAYHLKLLFDHPAITFEAINKSFSPKQSNIKNAWEKRWEILLQKDVRGRPSVFDEGKCMSIRCATGVWVSYERGRVCESYTLWVGPKKDTGLEPYLAISSSDGQGRVMMSANDSWKMNSIMLG